MINSHKPNELLVDKDVSERFLYPGSIVRHIDDVTQSYGVVIYVQAENVGVLWSIVPKFTFIDMIVREVKEQMSTAINNLIIADIETMAVNK